MLELILVSLAAGFAITVVLPFIQEQLNKIPGFTAVTTNKFIQLLLVGFIAMIAITFFTRLAKRIV